MFTPKIKKCHFVGIGGIGMCGIAEVLHNYGFVITGSDLQKSEVTEHLEKLGIPVTIGHSAGNVGDADLVVYSSAVGPDNPEIKRAWRNKIPFIKRAEMLGELMRTKWGIAVSGTHGKTTTTSMMGQILHTAKKDPTIIAGGKVKTLDSTVKLGESDFMVVEADEYDRSFLKIIPTGIIITSIEAEHLDCYADADDIKKTYAEFANRVPFYGFVIACKDSEMVRETIPYLQKKVITYGIDTDADYQADNISFYQNKSAFDLIEHDKKLGTVSLNVPGKYNILNALGAASFARSMDIDFPPIKKALEEFSGVFRRFELTRCENDILLVDDYAHHPSEIAACLQAAKNGWNRRLITIFQPHLFSRTRDFAKDFGKTLSISEVLIVTEIYPAREQPIPGVTGELICDYARKCSDNKIYYVPEKKSVLQKVLSFVQNGDMIMTVGAGDIWQLNKELAKTL